MNKLILISLALLLNNSAMAVESYIFPLEKAQGGWTTITSEHQNQPSMDAKHTCAVDFQTADAEEKTVHAIADGYVVGIGKVEDKYAYPEECEGKKEKNWGHYVKICQTYENNTCGGMTHVYAHMKANSIPPSIKQGVKVTRGLKIGIVGDTGCTTGVHLHLSFYKTEADGSETSYTIPYTKEFLSSYLTKDGITNLFDVLNKRTYQNNGWQGCSSLLPEVDFTNVHYSPDITTPNPTQPINTITIPQTNSPITVNSWVEVVGANADGGLNVRYSPEVKDGNEILTRDRDGKEKPLKKMNGTQGYVLNVRGGWAYIRWDNDNVVGWSAMSYLSGISCDNNKFTDLNGDPNLQTKVRWLCKNGIIVPREKFYPNDNIPRATFAKLLFFFSLGSGADAALCNTAGFFTDVDLTAPFCPYLKRLWNDNIISKNPSFRPKDNITQSEALTMVGRYFCGSNGSNGDSCEAHINDLKQGIMTDGYNPKFSQLSHCKGNLLNGVFESEPTCTNKVDLLRKEIVKLFCNINDNYCSPPKPTSLGVPSLKQ